MKAIEQSIIHNKGISQQQQELLFKTLQEQYTTFALENEIDKECGSTVNVVYVEKDTIYNLNCGDSRAFYCDGCKIHELNTDHRPTTETERLRIEQLGGKIERM